MFLFIDCIDINIVWFLHAYFFHFTCFLP
uniref:Uncharacterized protein n=1 Tax=Tetranychus urticae TaxID=32264 RepID=T1KH62_TETUR